MSPVQGIAGQLVEGAPTDATGTPHARKLFQASDGRLLFFSLEPITGADKVVYRISSDQGATWGTPVVVGSANRTGGLDVAQSGDSFLLAYTTGASSSRQGAFRELTAQTGVWQAGAEHAVVTGTGSVANPSVVDRGAGALGRRLAVAFTRSDALLGTEFLASVSEDGGATWIGPSSCGAVSWADTLAAQGERTICVTAPTGALEWREWTGVTWGPSQSLAPISGGQDAPSTVATDDGTLHLVAAGADTDGDPGIYHTALAPGAQAWDAPWQIGSGAAPVVTTDGARLRVYAADRLSAAESLIRSYDSTDTDLWAAREAMSGGPFGYVLDYNASWAFEERPGDALFGLADAAGATGNRIGTSSVLHRLDAAEKKLSFSFEPEAGGAVSTIDLWVSTHNPPTYRIGLQTDAGGVPSGTWLDEVRVGGILISGAYSEVSLPASRSSASSGAVLATVTIPSTPVEAHRRYHVVAEPVPSPLGTSAGPENWASFQGVGADAGAGEGLLVLDRVQAGSTWNWHVSAGEVPRVVVGSATATLVDQELAPGPTEAATEYSVPGESFVSPRDISPTEVRVFLVKNGVPPGPVTVRILDGAGTQMWSAQVTPASGGWVSVPASGLSLSAGGRYSLILDVPTRDVVNYWALASSDGESSSWGGAGSFFLGAPDRPGFNERTAEAQQSRDWTVDLVAFNSGAGDALYLGAAMPFDFATLLRAWADPGTTVATAWSYWNGSAWAALPGTRNDFGGPTGEAELSPPSDWAPTSVDGRAAYWAKVSAPGAPAPIDIDRATTIRDLGSPTVAPRAQGAIPVAYRNSAGAGVVEFLMDPGPGPLAGPDVTSYLSPAAWCLWAPHFDGQNTAKYIVGGDAGRYIKASVGCPNTYDPTQLAVSLQQGERRYIYGRLAASQNTGLRYMQLVQAQCASEYGVSTTENNLERDAAATKVTPVRYLFTAGDAGTYTCRLKARAHDLLTTDDESHLRILPSDTYLKIIGEDKVGAEQWREGDEPSLVDPIVDPTIIAAQGQPLIWPGDTRTVLSYTWTALSVASGVQIMGDVEPTTCWGYCDADGDGVAENSENGDYFNSKVATTLTVRPESILDPTLSCSAATYAMPPETITTAEHHVKLFHTLDLAEVLQAPTAAYCTRVFDIEVQIYVKSGNPVLFHAGGPSVGIAMNRFP
ncbi:MAG: hypothetical protein HY775_08660 [Acidobacteria bacterium]|nr:hypothetical protein [Acidobacteriota bacterium]